MAKHRHYDPLNLPDLYLLDNLHPTLIETTIDDVKHFQARVHQLNNDPEEMERCGVPEGFIDEWTDRMSRIIVLTTDERMRTVWERVNKRIKSKPEFADNLLGDEYLAVKHYTDSILDALEGGGYWDSLTPSRRITEHSKLIENIRSLKAQMIEVGLNDPTAYYFTEDECKGLYLDLLDDGNIRPFTPKSGVFLGMRLTELLGRIERRLLNQPMYGNTVVDRPNKDFDGLIYFVRKMAATHKTMFDTPLYEVITILASIFFLNKDISQNSVRSMLRKDKG